MRINQHMDLVKYEPVLLTSLKLPIVIGRKI